MNRGIRAGGTYLLHHASGFELVAVGQAADKAPLPLPVHSHSTGLALGPAERLTLRLDTVHAEVFLMDLPMDLSVGRPVSSASLLCFAIEKEITKNTAWTPEEAVRPTLDAALILVKDKDGPGGDHLSLRVDEPAGDAGNETAPRRLEYEQGIASGLYPA